MGKYRLSFVRDGVLCESVINSVGEAFTEFENALYLNLDPRLEEVTDMPPNRLRGVASGVVHGAIPGAIDVPLAV